MPMTVWPTDAADGSVANEARWRKMGRTWRPTSVIAGVGGELKPTLAGSTVTVADGAAWVDGHYAEALTSTPLTVTANGIVVIRFDPAANSAELVYRDGVSVPSQSPTGVYEMLIATMSGSAMTDNRTNLVPAGTGNVSRYESTLSMSASGIDSTTGAYLTGNIILPTVDYPRLLVISFQILPTVSGPTDFHLVGPPGATRMKRWRKGPTGADTLAGAWTWVHNAGLTGSNYAIQALAVSGTVSVTTAGAGDLNNLTITAIPIVVS